MVVTRDGKRFAIYDGPSVVARGVNINGSLHFHACHVPMLPALYETITGLCTKFNDPAFVPDAFPGDKTDTDTGDPYVTDPKQ